MKLALGTAQFGLDYGITNKTGRVHPETIKKILDCASVHDIDTLDTASAYGVSEDTLGKLLVNHQQFKIVTKTLPLAANCIEDAHILHIKEQIQQSFCNLKKHLLHCILIHHGADLLLPNGERIYAILEDLKKRRLISKIGVSVYSPDTTEKIIAKYPIDLVQLPINLLDQRFLKSGLLQKLKHQNIEIHVRSVLLQGLLLVEPNLLPERFRSISPQLSLLHTLSEQTGFSIMSLVLGFLKRSPEIDNIVLGVLNEQQLLECITAFNTNISDEIDYGLFECDDLALIDPSNW